MSLTATVFIAIYIVGIILTLRHPMYGVLLYLFEWHNHPPYWWWGQNWPDPRWSLLVAVLIVVSAIINRNKLTGFANFQFKPLIWLALIVINSYVVSLLFAIDPSESYRKAEIFLKLAVNYFLMIYIIRNPKDYKLIIFIILLCVANFGRIAWEVGSHRDIGVIAPGAGDGNHIALYMMTIVPFYAISFLLGNRWMKIFTVVSLPFVLNALILENSRGTILGLVSMAALAPFLVKGKLRAQSIIGLVLGVIIFLQLTNPQFWERQGTTAEYHKESSAMSRIYLWRGAFRFLQDHPFGGGGEGFEIVADEYVPELVDISATVHNTYLSFAAEWGYLGLFFYFGFIIHTLVITRKVRKEAKKLPDFNFYNLQALGLLLAMSGALVAFVFYSRQYMENFYWFSAFAVALRNIQLNALKETEAATQVAILENGEEDELVGDNPHQVIGPETTSV